MLILNRKQGESLVIAHRIRVTVVRVQGGRVKIGIEAPDDVPILRRELSPDGGVAPDNPSR